MFCPNCGNKVKDGSLFCGECGTSLKEYWEDMAPDEGEQEFFDGFSQADDLRRQVSQTRRTRSRRIGSA